MAPDSGFKSSFRKEPSKTDLFARFLRQRQSDYRQMVHVPNPANDFGMYKEMDRALKGIHEYLDELRSNQGKIGFGSQNLMSTVTKFYIANVQIACEAEDPAEVERVTGDLASNGQDMCEITDGLKEAQSQKKLAETGTRFSRTTWQERTEAELFGYVWPVIVGKKEAVPELLPWGYYEGNIQAYLYAFLDLVPEMAKALNRLVAKMNKRGVPREDKIVLYERYIAVAESIVLYLDPEKHVPGYVINNAYGRWAAFNTKLGKVRGTIEMVRDKYNALLA